MNITLTITKALAVGFAIVSIGYGCARIAHNPVSGPTGLGQSAKP